MNDLISRKAVLALPRDRIRNMRGEIVEETIDVAYIEQLPSAQQETNAYSNMSDEEFEEWLYKHGICNPDIHESIPCSVVPLLIDNAISELPFAQTQRMKGRWISRDGREDCYECSECHAVIESDEVYWRNNYFCYHCGADMRGEQ